MVGWFSVKQNILPARLAAVGQSSSCEVGGAAFTISSLMLILDCQLCIQRAEGFL